MNMMMYEIFLHLRDAHQTLSVAESCTGGGLAHEITQLAGISKIFVGSVTTYTDETKEQLLKIPYETLHNQGAVSKDVALMMANNCRELFSSTWALSTTGIAGPSGGSLKNPVGVVWIGLAGPGILMAKQFHFYHSSRMEHRQKTIDHALMMMRHRWAEQRKSL